MLTELATETPATRHPGAARNRVIAFGASLAFLSFLDRAAISQMSPAIARELHLSPAEMGLVFSAFGLTYAACEIPSGWLCDRFGARRLLTRVVILWSLLTAATGLAWNFASLAVVRLLFGAGESGCFPGLARVFRTWLPVNERGRAEGIKAASARVGAALTPPLIALLYTVFSWRQIFILFGAVGIVWGVLFHRWYRDNPSDHPDVSEEERQLLSASNQRSPQSGRETPWASMLRSRSVWALGVQWFCHYYGFYFYITWLPIYLLQARGLTLGRGALAASLPLLAAALGSYSGGAALNFAVRRIGSVGRTRKLFGYVAYAGAAALLLAFTSIANPVWALAALSLSSFLAELSGPISWTSAMDIGGENVGTVSGFMNMLGHFGGAVAPAVTGFLLTSTGNAWNVAFYCSAVIYAIGALCWIFIEPVAVVRPVRKSNHPQPGVGF